MKKSRLNFMIITVLAIAFVDDMAMAVSPLIDTIANAFPDIPYTTVLQVSTLPFTVSGIVSFISGFITGRKVGYRTTLRLGLICLVLSGIPAFFEVSFYTLLATRVIAGIAEGMIISLDAYIMSSFDENLSSKLLGMHVAVLNTGLIIMQVIIGFLGASQWRKGFLIGLFAVIPLIFSFFGLEEPEKREEETKAKGLKLKAGNILFFALALFLSMLQTPILLLLSTHIADLGLGDASVAGIVLSFYTVGGALGGLLYSMMRKLTGKKILSLYCLLMVIGYLLVTRNASVLWITVGTFFSGFGYFPVLTLLCDFCGIINNRETLNLGASLVWIGANLGGGMLAPIWINICTALTADMIIGTLNISCVIVAVLTVLFAVIDPVPKKKTEDHE